MNKKTNSIKPLKAHEVYVVVSDLKVWRQYPLPGNLVARSTITTIYAPINDSPYALVFYNFPASTQQVERKHIYVFSYAAHAAQNGTFGLTPAFGQ